MEEREGEKEHVNKNIYCIKLATDVNSWEGKPPGFLNCNHGRLHIVHDFVVPFLKVIYKCLLPYDMSYRTFALITDGSLDNRTAWCAQTKQHVIVVNSELYRSNGVANYLLVSPSVPVT